jgi:ABC-type transport system substrate-binding protein
MIFAAAADPAIAIDGDTNRVLYQRYGGLLMTGRGSADIVPSLAKSYEVRWSAQSRPCATATTPWP